MDEFIKEIEKEKIIERIMEYILFLEEKRLNESKDEIKLEFQEKINIACKDIKKVYKGDYLSIRNKYI